MNKNINAYNLSIKEALKKYNSNEHGLTGEEAKNRIKEYGLNEIKKKQNWKWARLILSQFNDALVWILLVATSLAFVFSQYRDGVIILIIITINATIGFLQEFKAERTLESIRKLTTDKAIVFRDGEKKEINSKFIVSGDIVFIGAGDNIPADGLIFEAYDFKVNSFIFTGESKSGKKTNKVISDRDIPLADIDNMVFMGETVSTGEAKFIVTGTGMHTELGRIANLAQEVKDDPTPMQVQMRKLGKNVTILSVTIGVLVIIGGQYFEMSLYQNFLFALALSVSVVPEGLPAAVSVALSFGMKKLLKDNILAKKLNAVETLGSVGIICTDKTGTITRNELMVVSAVINGEIVDVDGDGYNPVGEFSINKNKINPKDVKNLDLLFKIGTLCNDASLVRVEDQWKILGDPTEGALIVAGRKFDSQDKYYEIGEKKVAENPFSSERMRMSVVYENSQIISYVKGSPDIMIGLSKFIKIGDEIHLFSEEEKEKTRAMYNEMSSQALRVLAFAYRDLKDVLEKNKNEELKTSSILMNEEEKELVWVGMMAMIDPPRVDIAKAILECVESGIKVIMITGDYEITAVAIAERIGLINKSQVKDKNIFINGKSINTISDKELFEKIKKGACVFARITPEQKLRIASVLKRNGQTIAMTGDGVNDAPALRRADIGIAMGIIGTDVSKEASDMILLDDNFYSIVKGINQGRTIFKNLKKFIHYVFTSNASELITVIFGVLLTIPSPISAIQILAIDLGTDVFPSFALGFEPPEPSDGSKNKKINSKDRVMNFAGFRRILYLGVIMATGAVVTFVWSMLRGNWYFGDTINTSSILYIKSTTAAYAVLSMTQMANLLQSRSEKLSPFRLGFFKNPYVLWSMSFSFLILLCFMYVPFCQKYLGMLPIDSWDWLGVWVSFLAVFFWEEMRKKGN